MDLVACMRASQVVVVDEASEAMRRAHLPHYESSGPEVSSRHLEQLFSLVVECMDKKDLGPICEYSRTLSRERFESGFGMGEVQTAFNLLEEAIWHVVLPQIPKEGLVEAAGLVGTVLGAAKDTMTREWVSLATSRHVVTLDLSELFAGTDG